MKLGKEYILNSQTMSKYLNRLPKDSHISCYRCKDEIYIGDHVFAKSRQSPLSSRKNYANNGHPMPPKIYHIACAAEVHLV